MGRSDKRSGGRFAGKHKAMTTTQSYAVDRIINDITTHAQESGASKWNEWYVGISADARDRLFNGHGVKEQGDWWIFRQAISSSEARAVESHFVNKFGADGGTGGGDDTADMVYAYRKAGHTRP